MSERMTDERLRELEKEFNPRVYDELIAEIRRTRAAEQSAPVASAESAEPTRSDKLKVNDIHDWCLVGASQLADKALAAYRVECTAPLLARIRELEAECAAHKQVVAENDAIWRSERVIVEQLRAELEASKQSAKTAWERQEANAARIAELEAILVRLNNIDDRRLDEIEKLRAELEQARSVDGVCAAFEALARELKRPKERIDIVIDDCDGECSVARWSDGPSYYGATLAEAIAKLGARDDAEGGG